MKRMLTSPIDLFYFFKRRNTTPRQVDIKYSNGQSKYEFNFQLQNSELFLRTQSPERPFLKTSPVLSQQADTLIILGQHFPPADSRTASELLRSTGTLSDIREAVTLRLIAAMTRQKATPNL